MPTKEARRLRSNCLRRPWTTSGGVETFVRTLARHTQYIPDRLPRQANIACNHYSLIELALGGTITVPTLGDKIRVRVPAGTADGRTLRVRGRGIPKRNGTPGDLLVTVRVKVPTNLDDNATSALRSYVEAERASGFNPREGWAGAK